MSGLGSKIIRVGVTAALLFDVLWFIRLAITKLIAKLFRPKMKSILDESINYGICTTYDLDLYGHMNNARYFREMDFGKFDFWFRSGLESYFGSRRSTVYAVQHASTIRYRRPINFLRPFAVKTKLVWWDSRSLYFEQRIETAHDGFLRAIAFSRTTIVNADVEEMMKRVLQNEAVELYNANSPTKYVAQSKPELRDDFKLWFEFNSESSRFLLKERTQTS